MIHKPSKTIYLLTIAGILTQQLAARGQAPFVNNYTNSGPSTTFTITNQIQQLLFRNQTQEAMPILAKFISQRPRDPEGYYWQGIAFDALGLPENAYLSYNKAIELAAISGMDSARLRVDTGNVLLKLQRLDEAIFNYQRALEINPKLGYGYTNLARALIEKGDYQKALDNLDKAQNCKINSNQIIYYRLKALTKLGRESEAQKELQILCNRITNEEVKDRIKKEFSSL